MVKNRASIRIDNAEGIGCWINKNKRKVAINISTTKSKRRIAVSIQQTAATAKA